MVFPGIPSILLSFYPSIPEPSQPPNTPTVERMPEPTADTYSPSPPMPTPELMPEHNIFLDPNGLSYQVDKHPLS